MVERAFGTPADKLKELRLALSDCELGGIRREYSSICPPNQIPKGLSHIREHLGQERV